VMSHGQPDRAELRVTRGAPLLSDGKVTVKTCMLCTKS